MSENRQKKIKSKEQKETFKWGSVTNMCLSVNDELKLAERHTLDSTYYSVVAGSLRSSDNAERVLKNLRVDGLDAAFTELNPQGLYRVAYGRFVSKREALNLHNYVRFALKEDVWFLVEK